METREMYIGHWWENQKKGDHRKKSCMWVDNMKIGLREIGWYIVN
jgi:hypothetical protein